MSLNETKHKVDFQRWKSLIEKGNLDYSQGRYAAAEIAFAEALQEAEGWPPQSESAIQHEMTVCLAKSLNNMAALFHCQGKYKMAEELYLRALDIKQRIFPAENEEIGVALQNLAILYSAKRDYAQAEAYFLKTLPILENVLGLDHPKLAEVLQKYAVVLNKLGRLEESQTLKSRAASILPEAASDAQV